jgi:hypothetical protein
LFATRHGSGLDFFIYTITLSDTGSVLINGYVAFSPSTGMETTYLYTSPTRHPEN